MDLTTVHDGVEKRTKKKRVGRGIGSGHGKTASRGHKGQYASAGARKPSMLFIGGTTPLFRRVPKRGFSNGTYAKHFNVVNLGDINEIYQDGEEVTPQTLKEKGLAKKPSDGVRILGGGELTKKLKFTAHGFTKSAIAQIEAKGGSYTVIPAAQKPVKNKMKPRPPKVKA